MEELRVNDDPENFCFGCSPHNPRGLRMRFVRTADGRVESPCEIEEHFAGVPGVIHGGIQAALLDEAMGMAIHSSGSRDEDLDVVTAEFTLRYQKPAPTSGRLRVRGELVRRDGRDFYATGAILAEDGEVLTVAEARWRQIQRTRG